jgi:hypothetical protein
MGPMPPRPPTKLLAHLAASAGAEAELAARLDAEARRHAALGAATLQRVERDPFGAKTPWRATLELRGAAPALVAAVEGLAARLGAALDADASTALVGAEHLIVGTTGAPVRYQYLMRRRADFTHSAYLTRYREIHAEFGVRTPGHLGYVQVHLDPEASARAARAAGLGVCDFDSVSELHLASLGEFVRAVAGASIGVEAVADEEQFVDRPRSFDLSSRVTWRAAP